MSDKSEEPSKSSKDNENEHERLSDAKEYVGV